ncbi:hypothetical protein GCM10010319_16760 [Streptomyces blastmyceticus]|uniref:Uncharacterized protein n=1 Tax=Streptomyces blastmyceticus TaxID=68180 RepID=A0ABP3GB84_9ACTN
MPLPAAASPSSSELVELTTGDVPKGASPVGRSKGGTVAGKVACTVNLRADCHAWRPVRILTDMYSSILKTVSSHVAA